MSLLVLPNRIPRAVPGFSSPYLHTIFICLVMAPPPRKAGGLYGGIQFSSGTAVITSTLNEPATESEEFVEKKEETVMAVKAAPQEPTKPAEAGSSKATAGILYLLQNSL